MYHTSATIAAPRRGMLQHYGGKQSSGLVTNCQMMVAGGCLWRCSGVSLDLGASEAAWSSQPHCCAPATAPRNTMTARGAWCKAAFNQLFWYHCVKRYQINSNTSELLIVLFCPWNDCQWLVPSPRGVPSGTIRAPVLDLQLSVMKWQW